MPLPCPNDLIAIRRLLQSDRDLEDVVAYCTAHRLDLRLYVAGKIMEGIPRWNRGLAMVSESAP